MTDADWLQEIIDELILRVLYLEEIAPKPVNLLAAPAEKE